MVLRLIVLLLVGWTDAANVLFLSPHTSYSHTNFFIPVVKELAGRGHSVVFWNGLRPREEIKNVTQLYSEQLHQFNTNHHIGFANNNPFLLLMSLPERLRGVCSMCYSDPVFGQLIQMKNSTKFDLIVVEGFMNDCVLPLVPYFDAPFIYMTAIPQVTWLIDAADAPISFDRFPVVATPFTDEMNFLQRVANTIMGLYGIYYRNLVVLPAVDEMIAEILDDQSIPRLKDIENNVSLLITNSDFSMTYQYPKTSSIIEAGGLHFTESKPLPKVSLITFIPIEYYQ